METLTVESDFKLGICRVREQFKSLRTKAVNAYKSDAAASQVTLIGTTVAVFSTIMVIVACYLGLDMISPMLEVNGTLPSDVQDVFDTAKSIFKIILTCLSFVGIGLLVTVVRGWVGGAD